MSRLASLVALAALAAPSLAAPTPASASAVARPLACPLDAPTPKCPDTLVGATLAPAGKGALALKVAAAVPTLRAGQTVSGTLATSDPTLGDGSYADLYRVVGTPGTRYTVMLDSDDFDAYLSVGTTDTESDAGSLDVIESDDDGGGGTNSRLEFRMPQGGDPVYVRVNSLSEGETGAYTVSMQEGASADDDRPITVSPISVGETLDGRLDDGDGRLDDESFVDEYVFRAVAGRTYEIVLTSDDFDAYLSVGTGTGSDFASVETNDDGEAEGDGTNARLTVTATASGPMTIRANSLGNGEVGAYRLRIVQK